MINVKAIIFDWDNTIVDSFDHLVVFHQEVGRQLGWPSVNEEQIREVWGKPFEELIQALWPQCDSKEFDAAYKRYILQQTVPAIRGAVEAISKLKSNYLLGIVTAAPRLEVEHFMATINLNRSDFFMIQASGESEHHKPDPRVFDVLIRLLQGSNINKNEILYVGDSLSDLYAASDAELQFIAVLTGSTSRQQFHAAGVSKDRILYSVAELSEELRIGSA